MSSELWQLEHVVSHILVSEKTLLLDTDAKICERKIPK